VHFHVHEISVKDHKRQLVLIGGQ